MPVSTVLEDASDVQAAAADGVQAAAADGVQAAAAGGVQAAAADGVQAAGIATPSVGENTATRYDTATTLQRATTLLRHCNALRYTANPAFESKKGSKVGTLASLAAALFTLDLDCVLHTHLLLTL